MKRRRRCQSTKLVLVEGSRRGEHDTMKASGRPGILSEDIRIAEGEAEGDGPGLFSQQAHLITDGEQPFEDVQPGERRFEERELRGCAMRSGPFGIDLRPSRRDQERKLVRISMSEGPLTRGLSVDRGVHTCTGCPLRVHASIMGSSALTRKCSHEHAARARDLGFIRMQTLRPGACWASSPEAPFGPAS